MKREKQTRQTNFPGFTETAAPKREPRRFFDAVRLEREKVRSFEEYPFSIPSIRHLDRLEFHPAVTFFIGENGSGKSTLLEAIAVKAGFSAEGGDKQLQFGTHDTHSQLHKCMRLERSFGRPTDGFFLRAESLYNVASELEKLEKAFPAKSPFHAYGGKSLHQQSHGESFLAVMKERLQGGGVYLFDEPEAALSPQRQLSVLTLMHRLVHHQSQLIIATHSPILLAYPDARIYQFAESGITEVKYTETEHYLITKDFLNRHERMLKILLDAEDADLKSTQWQL
jgi:predicted ATPase